MPLLAALALLPAFCFPAGAGLIAPPQSVELAWNPSPDPTATGYMLEYGTVSGSYNYQIDAGTNTSIEVSGLVEGQTNYFVVTSYNAQGVQGPPSGQDFCMLPPAVTTLSANWLYCR